MDGEIDYTAVLADLEARRAELDAAINAIRRVSGQTSEIPAVGRAEKTTPSEVGSDTFFNMSVGDAAAKYLRMAKRPQSAQVIADALRKGGLLSQSQNFYSTVYTALKRAPGLVKVKRGEWGLAEWYPGGRRQKAKNGVQGQQETEDDDQNTSAEE